MIPMPSHECTLTLRSKKAAEMQTSSAITVAFAKFFTMASAYLYTSVTARPWKAWRRCVSRGMEEVRE